MSDLGYSDEIFDDVKIIKDFDSLTLFMAGCEVATCERWCKNCKEGCANGSVRPAE